MLDARRFVARMPPDGAFSWCPWAMTLRSGALLRIAAKTA
jgi:hypothetical protein